MSRNNFMTSKSPFDKNSISMINNVLVNGAINSGNLMSLNTRRRSSGILETAALIGAAKVISDINNTNQNNTSVNVRNTQNTVQNRSLASNSDYYSTNAQNSSYNNVTQAYSTNYNNDRNNSIWTNTATNQPLTGSAPNEINNINPEKIKFKNIPNLINPILKGQKIPLNSGIDRVKVGFGWNVTNNKCDVDVSAFMLNESQKALGEDWFVFYGQPKSPDTSISFREDNATDREIIDIDFTKINPQVTKIVFVLTINDALTDNLNFGMLKDAYARILDSNNNEIVSFKMTDYYTNVISMMIGEIYLYKGNWKFSAVGNGVSRDLAGLCQMYGLEVL
ncbi:Stress response protein SCP2 [Acetitomaculum ruminis DSM 5522]|uniref:Stress response protein SCP2 n=1 Tax=Acetitomaculum ruminis DSM 5522 TaxID=1120918 RepID=A0A1I0W220_9FIRM|nr:TerD family protein [Acetitomaculum ruminis]SFA82133.1 Stress response protein SCP2 [Acetitomaculum ruminis DSM 5522]